jgi:hypothetical protein
MFFTSDISGFGEASCDKDYVTNVAVWAKLEDECRITDDSSVEIAFNVHNNDGVANLTRNNGGLFVYRPDKYVREVATNTRYEPEHVQGDVATNTRNEPIGSVGPGNQETIHPATI